MKKFLLILFSVSILSTGALAQADSLIAHSYRLAKQYNREGKPQEALKELFKALKVAENTADKSNQADALYRIGILYDRMDEQDNALSYCKKSLDISKEIHDSVTIAACYHRMGLSNYSKKNYDIAREYLEMALEIRTKLNIKTGMAACMNGLGLIYLDKGQLDKAEEKASTAWKLWIECGDREGVVIATGNLGSIYLDKKDYEKAIYFSKMSYDSARAIHSFVFMEEAAQTLSRSYYASGDFKSAYEYYNIYSGIKDTLLNTQSKEQLARLNAQYASEKQEEQINSLKRDKQQQSTIRNLLGGLVLLVLLVSLAVFRSYRIKKKANTQLVATNQEIERSRDQIMAQKKEITDSIHYAKRIQQAILPPAELVKKLLPDSFVLYKPKDIVSGDFYWLEEWGDKVLFAAVDCTGHGVPGAFMSIVGYNLLNRALNEHGIDKPQLILNSLNKGISNTLRQSEEDATVKDGMDISICALNRKTMQLEFAGAYNSLYLVRDGKLTEIAGDKFPVGIFVGEEMQQFKGHELQLKKGDCLYLFTDGIADQFGGPKGKKFKYKQLQEKLLSMYASPMADQGKALDKVIEDWRGELEQIDDMLVIGVRV